VTVPPLATAAAAAAAAATCSLAAAGGFQLLTRLQRARAAGLICRAERVKGLRDVHERLKVSSQLGEQDPFLVEWRGRAAQSREGCGG